MTFTTLRLVVFLAAVGLFTAPAASLRAEDTDPAALAAALKNATSTLQGGLKASEREGRRFRPSSRSRMESSNCRSIR